ncbi:MAG: DNA-methyltransferase [Acidobacteriaceae bacterium]
MDSADPLAVSSLMGANLATLAIHDPPYNLVAFETRTVAEYIEWCRRWVSASLKYMNDDCSLYVWLGADQRNHYQPLPDFMLMMRDLPIQARSLITVRNQRGYGTQKNWMAVRQELLYYIRGNPVFNIAAEYTDIPKTLKGYYKEVGGEKTENTERGKGDTIRAGNVWLDIQQVFYRLHENVSGCYAQKPLKSISRIIDASSQRGDCVIDFFAHSGTTLLASEIAGRRCVTAELDPVFCEIAIRRLEHYRTTGKTGWQNGHAFESSLHGKSTAMGSDTEKEHSVVQDTLF